MRTFPQVFNLAKIVHKNQGTDFGHYHQLYLACQAYIASFPTETHQTVLKNVISNSLKRGWLLWTLAWVSVPFEINEAIAKDFAKVLAMPYLSIKESLEVKCHLTAFTELRNEGIDDDYLIDVAFIMLLMTSEKFNDENKGLESLFSLMMLPALHKKCKGQLPEVLWGSYFRPYSPDEIASTNKIDLADAIVLLDKIALFDANGQFQLISSDDTRVKEIKEKARPRIKMLSEEIKVPKVIKVPEIIRTKNPIEKKSTVSSLAQSETVEDARALNHLMEQLIMVFSEMELAYFPEVVGNSLQITFFNKLAEDTVLLNTPNLKPLLRILDRSSENYNSVLVLSYKRTALLLEKCQGKNNEPLIGAAKYGAQFAEVEAILERAERFPERRPAVRSLQQEFEESLTTIYSDEPAVAEPRDPPRYPLQPLLFDIFYQKVHGAELIQLCGQDLEVTVTPVNKPIAKESLAKLGFVVAKEISGIPGGYVVLTCSKIPVVSLINDWILNPLVNYFKDFFNGFTNEVKLLDSCIEIIFDLDDFAALAKHLELLEKHPILKRYAAEDEPKITLSPAAIEKVFKALLKQAMTMQETAFVSTPNTIHI